ncbi:MAG: TetR/AcrR family transcriptional regulator [Anaerolineaceae bacterium]
MDEKKVEEKIINAAIECIEKYGIQDTTNRKIAEIAGINSAAINYYFRSKDILIRRVMEVTLDNAFDWKDFSKYEGLPPEEKTIAIFEELASGGIQYPGLTRAHFYELVTGGNYDSLVVERFNDFVIDLSNDLEKSGAKMDKEQLNLACMQISSAVMMMILTPAVFKKKFDFDLHNEAQKRQFITRLVERLLTP